MMKKVYYLSTCDTCKRIMSELRPEQKGFELQDIKHEKITAAQLKEMHALAGSYEALFSRIARKYKEMKLGERTLSEDDYRKVILEEYTFLKRPVIIYGDKIFIGNSKSTVAAAKAAIG